MSYAPEKLNKIYKVFIELTVLLGQSYLLQLSLTVHPDPLNATYWIFL